MSRFNGGYYVGLFTGMSFAYLKYYDYFTDGWGWYVAWILASILVNLIVRTIVKA